MGRRNGRRGPKRNAVPARMKDASSATLLVLESAWLCKGLPMVLAESRLARGLLHEQKEWYERQHCVILIEGVTNLCPYVSAPYC